jgi:hypothetical protein
MKASAHGATAPRAVLTSGAKPARAGGSVPSPFIEPRADDVGLVDLQRILAAFVIEMDILALVAQDPPAALQP